jgi:hypothetical protein
MVDAATRNLVRSRACDRCDIAGYFKTFSPRFDSTSSTFGLDSMGEPTPPIILLSRAVTAKCSHDDPMVRAIGHGATQCKASGFVAMAGHAENRSLLRQRLRWSKRRTPVRFGLGRGSLP